MDALPLVDYAEFEHGDWLRVDENFELRCGGRLQFLPFLIFKNPGIHRPTERPGAKRDPNF